MSDNNQPDYILFRLNSTNLSILHKVGANNINYRIIEDNNHVRIYKFEFSTFGESTFKDIMFTKVKEYCDISEVLVDYPDLINL